MRLLSILGAYIPGSSNYCFHLGMFIACHLLAPGPKYQGPEDENQCNPVKYLGYLKWMHLALFISVTIEHFTSENISTTALLCPKKQQQTEDTKEPK